MMGLRREKYSSGWYKKRLKNHPLFARELSWLCLYSTTQPIGVWVKRDKMKNYMMINRIKSFN